MKMSRLIEAIEELSEDYGMGFAGRPDDSGIRSKGVDRQPTVRLNTFPYDRDVTYGEPGQASDRGSGGGASGPNHAPLTPKDDSHFALKLLGLEDFAELAEVLGAPELFSRAGGGEGGSSIPGVNGWSNNPPKPWDEDEHGMDEEFNPEVPDTEEVPNGNLPDFRGETDDDLENKLDRLYGQEDNMNFVDPRVFGQPDFHVVGPDPWTVINTYLNSRGLQGMLPRESAWDRMRGLSRKPRENP